MTTLDPQLNKLRNKELSFGCVIKNEKGRVGYIIEVTDIGISLYMGLPYWIGNKSVQYNAISPEWIVGHPLTWGRISHLHGVREFEGDVPYGFDDAWARIMVLLSQNHLLDQNELQRMTSPKRPELRELLVKFAEYI